MKKILFLAILVSTGAASAAGADPIVFSAVSSTAAGITPIRDAFRSAIGGGTVAGPNGSFGGVRREINWDGVPDAFAAPNLLPGNFFNVNSPRGVVLSTPGTGLEVSANAGVAPIEFGDINASYPGTFAAFSPQRLFAPLGSNTTDIHFFLPGTNTPALTSAFGVIFTDVDFNSSYITFFDAHDNELGDFFVPFLPGSETFSFLGVVFDSPIVNRVRIVAGNFALGPNDGGIVDAVAMDDFIYAEPATPVAEPASLLLFGTGALGLLSKIRRR